MRGDVAGGKWEVIILFSCEVVSLDEKRGSAYLQETAGLHLMPPSRGFY